MEIDAEPPVPPLNLVNKSSNISETLISINPVNQYEKAFIDGHQDAMKQSIELENQSKAVASTNDDTTENYVSRNGDVVSPHVIAAQQTVELSVRLFFSLPMV